MRTEPHQLVVVEPLAAKPQHEVIGPCLLDGVHRVQREFPRQVDPFDVSAERCAGWLYLDPLPLQHRCHFRFLQLKVQNQLVNRIAC